MPSSAIGQFVIGQSPIPGNSPTPPTSGRPPRYNPPTKVNTREYPFLSIVVQQDPDWARGKFWDVEYEFTGRTLYANPYKRGAYDGIITTTLQQSLQCTQVSGKPGPDWTYTATQIIEDAGPGVVPYVYSDFGQTADETAYVLWGDFKPNGRHLTIGFGSPSAAAVSGVFAVVNLQNGQTILPPDVYGTGFTAGSLWVQKLDNGYWRVGITGTTPANTPIVSPFVQLGDGGIYTGDGASGLFFDNLEFRLLNTQEDGFFG